MKVLDFFVPAGITLLSSIAMAQNAALNRLLKLFDRYLPAKAVVVRPTFLEHGV